MENMKLRCHPSIIFESIWQFWIVIALMLIQQAESVVEVVRNIGTDGIMQVMRDGGIWVLIGILAVTAVILTIQFIKWKKTWIMLEDNLVIIERNTLKRYKNTIAVENISAVNMERNIFERLVGTYKIKMDTSSMTTAATTDVSIVLKEKEAVLFRKSVLEKIAKVKGLSETKNTSNFNLESVNSEAVSPETHPDRLFDETEAGRKVFHSSKKDMVMHALYTLPVISLLTAVTGIAAGAWYIASFGFMEFIENALGGFIAVLIMVVSAIYNLVKRFITYYDFTVYRDGRDLHVRCGLLKLKSYTIPVDKITAVEIEQPLISRICGRYSAKVVTVGVGDEEGESSNITMSLTGDEISDQMSELIPEYEWAMACDIKKEERIGVGIRMIKSIKWHILSAAAVFILIFVVELPLWIAILAPAAVDLIINVLYILSHKAAGYDIKEEGLIVSSGYLTKTYTICTYRKMQVLIMNYHPVAAKQDVGDGVVMLLNSASSIPYIKREQAFEISKRIIRGGRK